mgnify:CR=1 FL=1
MKPVEIDESSPMQRVFRMARVNSREYHGDKLPELKWDWPQSTWFRQRLAALKAREAADAKKAN